MVGKLKAISVEKLKPGLHSDGGGLYLDVQDSGSRSWILRTVVCGKRRTLGLGSFTTTSLSDARVKSAELRAKARNGEDIVAERATEKLIQQRGNSVPTFKEAALEYHKALTSAKAVPTKKKKTHRNARAKITSDVHAYNWLQSLELYVFPAFGSKQVDKVDSADLLRALGPVWNTIPDTARRTLRRASAVFDYCAAAGWRNIWIEGGTVPVPMANPCFTVRAALPNHTTGVKHHESMPYDQLPAFIQRLRTSQSALSVKLAFEFLILTSSRTGEALGAKWEEIDIENRTWTIPAGRMKMDKEHKVPLSARALEILQLAKQFNDDDVVFPGRYAGHPLSSMAFLMTLRRMGYELTAHGFRATFKTWAEEKTKFDTKVIEASMAHVVKGVEKSYLRTTFFDERQKLMDKWSEFVTAAPAAKVVKIR